MEMGKQISYRNPLTGTYIENGFIGKFMFGMTKMVGDGLKKNNIKWY